MSTNIINIIFKGNYDQEVEGVINLWATDYELAMLNDEWEELSSYELLNGHDSENNYCPDCRKHMQACKCWAHAMAANDNEPRCGCCGAPVATCDCNPLWRKIEEHRMEEVLDRSWFDADDLEDTPF